MRTPASLSAPALLVLATGTAHAEFGWGLLNMTQGVTAMSRQIYGLHMLMLWLCVAIGVVVFGVMLYSIFTFRKSRGAVADTSFTHSTPLEIAWTIAPVVILVACALPATKTLIKTEDLRNTQLTIRVTGYQWGWHYEYLPSGVNFFSRLDRASDAARQLGSGIDPNTVPHYLQNVDHPLVVPVGVKVRLLITADDVIHSWWVPAFGVKKDAIPGFINEAWFDIDADKPGIYRGQCAELCGRGHGFMPIVVDARKPADFQSWLKAQIAALAPKDGAGPAAGPSPAPTPGAAPAAAGAAAPAAGPATPAPAAAATTSTAAPAAAAFLLAATATR
ncbi:MAG TPA: cytochrome c oxidase subunit II [Steroidobacteraceae bacterium]|nr:cytochrome c oxidase subunit II [Steroidobacteraceae bacterium]